MYGTELALSPVTTMSITTRVYVASAPHSRTGAGTGHHNPFSSSCEVRTMQGRGMALETLGHIRLIRKIGEGARAEVYLARPRDGVDDDTVALKVFRTHVDPLSISAEIEALARAEGPHALELIDLTTTPGGVHALILRRLAGGNLARLIRERTSLAGGEAITILAPLALAVSRMHRNGAVHAGIRAEAVQFDSAGAPVLGCFGRAFPIKRELSPAALSQQPGVALDLGSFAVLARAVLARVDEPALRGLSDFANPGPALESHDWLERFSDRLFDGGDACAVDFSPDVDAAPSRAEFRLPVRTPATLPTGQALALDSVVPAPVAPVVARPASAAADTITARLHAIRTAITERIAADDLRWLERVRTAMRAVRPRLWVIVGIVGVALVAAMLVLGPRPSSPTTLSTPSVAPTAPAPDAGEVTAIGLDDPARALVSLVAERERCISQLSVLCLDGVDQPGSGALAVDHALIRQIQSGGELPPSWAIAVSRVTLAERLGDSALIEISDPAETEPASILLMKGEAGWRIRDYLSN